MDKLAMVIDTATTIQQLSVLDSCITICDSEGIIKHIVPANTFILTGKVGDKVATSGAMYESLVSNDKRVRSLPAEVLGVPAKVIAIPIQEDGKLVGVIAMSISLTTQSTLKEAAQTIATTSEEVAATTEEVASAAALLAGNMEKLQKKGEIIIRQVNKTDDVLKFVNDVASNSRLLGLNASIEAARAGEAGRGFAVVAGEIGKMAQSSEQAVKDIQNTLTAIRKNSTDILAAIKDITVLGERQAAATEQIGATTQSLAQSAANIEKIAEII